MDLTTVINEYFAFSCIESPSDGEFVVFLQDKGFLGEFKPEEFFQQTLMNCFNEIISVYGEEMSLFIKEIY